jgi:hypothetical protein
VEPNLQYLANNNTIFGSTFLKGGFFKGGIKR